MPPYVSAPPLAPVEKISNIAMAVGYAVVGDKVQANKIGEGEALAYSVQSGWAEPRQKIIETEPVAMDLPMRGQ